MLQLAIAFAAGYLSLALQTTILRLSNQEIGGNRSTSAAILATALLGLAIGSACFGGLADKLKLQTRSAFRHMLPALLLGLASAATLLLAFFARTIAAGISGSFEASTGQSFWSPLLFSILVSLPVHVIIGGIIPSLLASRESSGGVRKIVSLFYAVETIGVAVGALLTVFVLIPQHGIRASMIACGGMGLFVSLLGILFRGKANPGQEIERSVTESMPDSNSDADAKVVSSASARQASILLLVVLMSSFASIGMELIWQRFFVVLFGSDSRSYAVVVAATLIGIAIGAWLAGFKLIRTKTPLAYGLSLAAISCGLSVSLMVLRHGLQIETMHASLDWLLLTPFYGRLVLSIFVVLLPSACIGFAFPLVSEIWVQESSRVGKGMGRLFAVVAIGNVIGVFCCASFLIPAVGLYRSAVVLSVVPFAAALIVMTLYPHHAVTSRTKMIGASVASGLACGVLFFMNANAAPIKPGLLQTDQWKEVFYFEDGLQTVAVAESEAQPDRRRLLIDGVTIGESRGGVDEKQRLLAHLPFLLKKNGDAEKVYTIGLGTGILASELAGHEFVETVVATELSNGVIQAATMFSDESKQLASDAKVQIINDDGIRFLRNAPTKFDVIVSDGKSRPGAASNLAFFSRDYYELCESKLSDNGLFVQWVSINCAQQELATILKTFAGSFRFGHIGFALPGSVYLVGSNNELELDPARMSQLLERPSAAALKQYGWSSADDILSMYWMDQGVAESFFDNSVPVNTFDRPTLELFAWDSFQFSVQALPPPLTLIESLVERDSGSFFNGAALPENEIEPLSKARAAAREMLEANKVSQAKDEDWLDKSAAHWKKAIALLPQLSRQREIGRQYRQLAAQAATASDQATEFSALLNVIELNCGLSEDRLRAAKILESHGAFEAALPHHYAAVKQAGNQGRFSIAFAECMMVLQKYGRASQQLHGVVEESDEPALVRKAKLLLDICTLRSGRGDRALLDSVINQASEDLDLRQTLMKFQIPTEAP